VSLSEATYLDKTPTFKTANGRRVPLTDLLGLAIPANAKLLLNKDERLARWLQFSWNTGLQRK